MMMTENKQMPKKLLGVISNHPRIMKLSQHDRLQALLKQTLRKRLGREMESRKQLGGVIPPFGIPTVYPGIGGWFVWMSDN
jgi:hypothetical protein